MSTYRSRAVGLEAMLDELFGRSLLEGDPIPAGPDAGFPLRPFANRLPLDDLLATEPRTDESPAERLYRRAVEASSRGRVSEAIHRYRELLTLEPGHAAARSNLSLLLESSGDPEEALVQLEGAIAAAPDDPQLLVARGSAYSRLKRYSEAEADLRRAARLSPQSATTLLALGLTLWRKGVVREAIEVLRRAIDLEPDNATAHYYLGEALNQANDLPGARAALERSAELAPEHGRPFRLLGRVLDRLGRPEDAREAYLRAREAGDS
jgi:tetratricopeptide (TPR) repeat protein